MISKKKLILLSVLLGNALEWLEFTLFAYLSPKLSSYFFSEDIPSLALLKTYMIFGSSYLARPLGAIFFGYMGDKKGRVFVLQHSLILMSLATAGMAFIPSYKQIGFYSPVFLILLRLLQGFSLSGEFTSSQLILLENFGKKNPFSYGTLGPLSASCGMVLGSLIASSVYSGFLPDNSWRYAFLGSSCLGFLGFFLRRFLSESVAFDQIKAENKIEKNPPIKAITSEKKTFALCFFASMFISNFVYIGSFFYERMAFAQSNLSKASIHESLIFGQVLASFIMFLGFYFMPKVQTRLFTLIVLLIAMITSPLMMDFTSKNSLLLLYLGQSFYGLVNGLASSSLLSYVSLQFPPEIRTSGTGLAWSLGASLFGGSSLSFSEFLFTHGKQNFIGFYLSLSAFLCFIFLFMSKNAQAKKNSRH